MTIATFSAETLATLTLYYVYFPLEKYTRGPHFTVSDTQKSFY